MDIDSVFADVGEYGKYQKLVLWFILLPSTFPCGFHAYNQLFMAAVPDHWCKIPELNGIDVELAKNLSIPLIEKDGTFYYSKCKMFNIDYQNVSIFNDNTSSVVGDNLEQIPCKYGWIYDRSKFKTTVVMDWNLVCQNDFLVTLALILFGAGGLVGNYIFGYAQDRLGRKPSFYIYLTIQCIFGFITTFAPNFYVWIIFRIGVGFTVPAILGTPYVLAIELVGPHYRTLVTILINIAYSLALVSLAVIVWVIRDWRILSLATTLPFLLLFALYWLLPESPRWLLAQGRYKEAEEILSKISRINGRKLPANYIKYLKIKTEKEKAKEKERKKIYGVKHLFKTRNLRTKTLIITFIWFTNTSVYVGLSYYAPVLGGDEFLNFFLAGAVELPTYLFLWPSMETWGRRWTLCVSMIVGGSACLATFLVRHDSLTTLALYCIGKMGISSSFVVLPLMASELYPTVVRGLGMSISSVMGMFGPVFIPLVNYLGSDMLTLPLVIMGTLLVVGGMCSLLLPETLNQPLPQTLEDGEKVGLDQSACCQPPQRTEKI